MKIWNGIENVPSGQAVVATVGNYDGVHLGHQAIMDSMVRVARGEERTSLLITFEPHPLSVVAPDRRPKLLQTRRQKLESLEATGLDAVLILRFDAHLAALAGEEFFSEVLCGPLRIVSMHVGNNFRFGHRRAGDAALLETLGRQYGFDVVGVSPVEVGELIVSSSAIRSSVDEGDVARAARMLGRPFAVEGEVVHGDGRGQALRYPTANLETDNESLPRRGVYVTETVALATRYPSVSNVGVRPTFNGHGLTVESHLLDFDGDLYGEQVEVRFLARLRDERKFDGPEQLADQIARDRAAAAAYFQNLPLATP